MKVKRTAAAVFAALMAFSAAGCGKSEDISEESSFVEQLKVPDSQDIEAIPEGSEKELVWLSYWDLNPAKGSGEKRAELSLFEQKGGSITYKRTTSSKKYDDLATSVLSGSPADIFPFDTGMVFPYNCVMGMFQPIDEIVNFDDALWSDVKETADQYTLSGEHFVAPIQFIPLSVITYDADVIDNNALEDPLDLYNQGKWDWDAMMSIMRDWSASGTAETPHYGINGWFQAFFYYSTGKTLISYDETADEYVSDITDVDLERAANFIYTIKKDGLYYSDWIGDASEAFNKNILFYAMGPWASMDTHTPDEGDNWKVVPIPRDPNSDTYYCAVDTTAYMWVKGSQKRDAVKCWFECAKIVNTQQSYKDLARQKFMLNNPNWFEESYDMVYNEILSGKLSNIVDIGAGINNDQITETSDDAINAYLYNAPTRVDEDGTQFTWTQLRNTYSSYLESKLSEFNKMYKDYLASK